MKQICSEISVIPSETIYERRDYPSKFITFNGKSRRTQISYVYFQQLYHYLPVKVYTNSEKTREYISIIQKQSSCRLKANAKK